MTERAQGVSQADTATGGSVVKDILPVGIQLEIANRACTPLIEAGRTLPAQYVLRFFTTVDNQRDLELKLHAGDDALVERNTRLGRVIVENIPRTLAGEQPIDVTVAVDRHGVINVSAEAGAEPLVVWDDLKRIPVAADRMLDDFRARRRRKGGAAGVLLVAFCVIVQRITDYFDLPLLVPLVIAGLLSFFVLRRMRYLECPRCGESLAFGEEPDACPHCDESLEDFDDDGDSEIAEFKNLLHNPQ